MLLTNIYHFIIDAIDAIDAIDGIGIDGIGIDAIDGIGIDGERHMEELH